MQQRNWRTSGTRRPQRTNLMYVHNATVQAHTCIRTKQEHTKGAPGAVSLWLGGRRAAGTDLRA